ncbi:nuclease HARBI1 [Trichonephila clavipes]|nr:nuclease HARBI1 [Trichonephila clavipes]
MACATKVLQSKSEVRLDEVLNIEIITIRRPVGSGKTQQESVNPIYRSIKKNINTYCISVAKTLLTEEKLESKTPCNNALNPVEQVLIALRFYAVACMQLAIADLFDVSQPTVCRVVHRVSEDIASLLPEFNSPTSQQRRVQNGGKEILQYHQISKVIRALDGTFVRIVSPGGEDAERFHCRKKLICTECPNNCGF